MIYGSNVLPHVLSYRTVEGRVLPMVVTVVLIAGIRDDGVICVTLDAVSPSFQVGETEAWREQETRPGKELDQGLCPGFLVPGSVCGSFPIYP